MIDHLRLSFNELNLELLGLCNLKSKTLSCISLNQRSQLDLEVYFQVLRDHNCSLSQLIREASLLAMDEQKT